MILLLTPADVQLSSERLSVSTSAHLDEKDRIQIAARSVC